MRVPPWSPLSSTSLPVAVKACHPDQHQPAVRCQRSEQAGLHMESPSRASLVTNKCNLTPRPFSIRGPEKPQNCNQAWILNISFLLLLRHPLWIVARYYHVLQYSVNIQLFPSFIIVLLLNSEHSNSNLGQIPGWLVSLLYCWLRCHPVSSRGCCCQSAATAVASRVLLLAVRGKRQWATLATRSANSSVPVPIALLCYAMSWDRPHLESQHFDMGHLGGGWPLCLQKIWLLRTVRKAPNLNNYKTASPLLRWLGSCWFSWKMFLQFFCFCLNKAFDTVSLANCVLSFEWSWDVKMILWHGF